MGSQTQLIDAAIDRLCRPGPDAHARYDRIASVMAEVAPSDIFCLLGTDPGTLLPVSNISNGVLGGPDSGGSAARAIAAAFWENELQIPDVNKYSNLARAPHPVGVLSQATGEDLTRSPRYRQLMVPMGVEHELRAALVADGTCWGFLVLFRRPGQPDFTAEQAAAVERLAPRLAVGQRSSLIAAVACRAVDGPGQGVIVLDGAGRVEMMNPDAERWLENWAPTGRTTDDPGLPDVVFATAASVRARHVEGEACPQVATRVRTEAGVWVTVAGSLLTSTDGRVRTAIVLGPAPASSVLPLLAQAYDLTPREHQVTCSVLAGRTTEETATDLFISSYTVQDHLKSVFEKVGVRSRRGLVAALFSAHYLSAATPNQAAKS